MNPVPPIYMGENACILLPNEQIKTYSTLPNKPTVADGYVECPECHSSLHVKHASLTVSQQSDAR
jgi:hypothetical protein